MAQITDEMIAENKVERFVSRFQPSYRWLACHVALPLVLTPELVNYLRMQFLRSENIPWIAEADLLLSDLCRPVGYELYVMDKDVKLYLLEELEKEFGDERIREIANLLISYVKHIAKTNPFISAKDIQTQQWGAMLYLDTDEVVKEINDEIEKCVNKAELARLRKIAEDFKEQIAKKPEDYQKFTDLAQKASNLLTENPPRKSSPTSQDTYEDIKLKEFDINVAKVKIEESVDFSQLQNYLQAQQWQKADEETARLMLKIANKENQGWLEKEDIEQFPCDKLLQINKLWVEASDGYFGFSVQNTMWKKLGGKRELSGKTNPTLQSVWNEFSRQVGWLSNGRWVYDSLVYNLSSLPQGCLPIGAATNPDRRVGGYRRILYDRFQSCQSQTISLKTFPSETVFLNKRGEIIDTQPVEALYFEEELTEGINLNMMQIPAGEFWMGTEDEEIERLVEKFDWDGYRREKPQHKVTIKKKFYMSQTLITQGQWKAVAKLDKVARELKENPSEFKGDDNLPVENVSWHDAVEFCARLSRETGKNYRLPSEGEWEYACRGVKSYQSSVISKESKSFIDEELSIETEDLLREEWNKNYHQPFYFGETITDEVANYDASYTSYADEKKGEYRQKTTPVGQFYPNAFGLYDMHGNLWEWCADTFYDSYKNAPEDGSVWDQDTDDNDNRYQNYLANIEVLLNDDNKKVRHGGSWTFNPNSCRSAYRFNDVARDSDLNVGFRVVCG